LYTLQRVDPVNIYTFICNISLYGEYLTKYFDCVTCGSWRSFYLWNHRCISV